MLWAANMPNIKGTSRRSFRINTHSITDVDLNHTILPLRADHYARVLGYRIELILDDVTYSTTATWHVDLVLSTVPFDEDVWGSWSLDNLPSAGAPPVSPMLDVYRFHGGEGRIVTSGGYLVVLEARSEPVVCDVAVPAIYMVSRRLTGVNQTYGVAGYVDYEWVKASPGDMAAINLAWAVKGLPLG